MIRKETQEPATDWVAIAARAILGFLFIVSGFSKAIYPPEAFAAALEGYRLFPDAWLMPIAQVLPWVELLTGAALLSGYLIRRCALVLGGMLLVFEAALLSVLARNIDLAACGCYGAYGPHFTPKQATAFDLMLLVLVFMAYRSSRQPYSLDAWIEKGSTP